MSVQAVPLTEQPDDGSNVMSLAEEWLADAYELVQRGWCAGLARDGDGNACAPEAETAARWSAVGALTAAWRASGRDDEVALRAWQRANLALTAAVNDVPRVWNDAPGRRQADVAEALLRAVTLANDPALFANGRRASFAATLGA